MLNEFSRQSDLQVLFDFNILRGMKTRAVTGDLDASTALKNMLKGTNLVFDFVNDHTLAVTPKKPSWTSMNLAIGPYLTVDCRRPGAPRGSRDRHRPVIRRPTDG